MIISPPFLVARTAQHRSDVQYVEACMTGDAPGEGSYPVSHRMNWHGGLHLEAPTGPNGRLPVRAIADGTVVLCRQPIPRPATQEAQRQHALGYYRGWTDNGVVVIRHETEIGEGANAQVTFYSIYQHLHTIRPAVRAGQRIYRKGEIGQAGYVYGQPNRIHFEIVCDDANLRRLVGRAAGGVPINADGRTDSVYGAMYFALPAGTQVMNRNPDAAPPRRGQPALPPATVVHTMAESVFVGIEYATGAATITTFTNEGEYIGAPRIDRDYEYNLYAEATRIYPRCPSAGYELLRFGRVLGPDALNPAGAPHWRQIRYPGGGEGWVNLNAGNIRKFSDADFPHWRGWLLFDDAQDANSRCDSNNVLRAVDINRDGTVTRQEAEERLRALSVRNFMKRLICKFPSEWDAATIDARWGWLRDGSAAALSGNMIATEAESLNAADFERLQAHLRELCFWNAGTIGIPANHWRFDPREFILHFRRCGWISESELARIYPDANYPRATLTAEGRGRTPTTIREQYRVAINMVTRKHFINTPTRQAHFYGQGALESLQLALMIEGSVNFSRNPTHASLQPEVNGYYAPTNPRDYLFYLEGRLGNVDVGDGPKFRGRGMKQLTGRENYSKYWVYRGWLDRGSFDSGWWRDRQRLRPPAIDTPQDLSVNDYNCIDAGGWYWEAGAASANFNSINRIIVERDVSRAAIDSVTFAINGGRNGLPERISHTQRIAPILDDSV